MQNLDISERLAYSAFMTGFTQREIHYGDPIKGNINTMISTLFINNLGDKETFTAAVKSLDIPKKLKDKALFLSDRCFKIHQFRLEVGGPNFANSQTTQALVTSYENFLDAKICKEHLEQAIDKASMPYKIKIQAKAFVNAQPAPTAKASNAAQLFSLDTQGIQSLYAQKKTLRNSPDFDMLVDKGGAVNIGYLYSQGPDAKVGIMIAANSGLPGGLLGSPEKVGKVTPEDMKLKTQEESIWANAVLTACGLDADKQKAFHNSTISGKWGMAAKAGTMTLQGIDFTMTINPKDYNQVHVLKNSFVSQVSPQKQIIAHSQYPAVFAFADSINANQDAGTPQGTMQRTLNKKAIHDYAFFCECITEKLRSALDSFASEGVTHPLVALLSCGVYAGKHAARIREDFPKILEKVLNESVGPMGEERGCYFENVIIPKIG